jgi:AcrR family transcriptional regulator
LLAGSARTPPKWVLLGISLDWLMGGTRNPSPRAARRRRADAERSVARILEATVEVLASDPDASMADIARHAGVVRATIYVHFANRECLIAAVTDRAIAEVTQAIEHAEPGRSDPVEALARVVAATWQSLGRFHALVAINTQLPHVQLQHPGHATLAKLHPLIKRGQRDGSFRDDVPATWHLAMLRALVHAASAEFQAGNIPKAQIEAALITTVLGALAAPPTNSDSADA